jgi:class 3 adenylate cyclase
MECPSCHSEMPDDSRFCEACGAALPVRCATCGATSRAGARFCSKCGNTLTLEGAGPPTKPATALISPATQSAASAERRQLTVMFVDLVGSTALSARLDPEDMREIIGAYHRCCAEQITKTGGFVAKYMGDGVLAYFGYPEAHEDDAERGVRAALELTEAVPRLGTGQEVSLQVRIGIATGLVVVGDLIGEGAAQEQGVVGDTPNVAARLQALAEPGQMAISDSTRRLIGGMFEYRDLGRVTLKGLPDPVQAWHVLGASTVESRFEALHETNLTPLVGREEEIELLLRRWGQVKNGDGRVVLLSGEPGIGKSRLIAAVQEALDPESHTRLRYFCSPHHQDSALYPIIAQLERAGGIEREDGPETKLNKLEALLARTAPSTDDDLVLLAELLSIPTGGRYRSLTLAPQRKKEKTFEALLRQIETVTRQQPVLMVFEDVHWIDPSSRELLDLTVEWMRHLSVLLLITFRPEFQPPWTGPAHVTMLTLNRLARRAGAVMVERLVGDKAALPSAVVEEIIERTDGVPLFVEELTKAVLEAGAGNANTGATVAAMSTATLVIPATLHASLIARLDRLGPAKNIAQIGAAIGREFAYALLAAVAPLPEPRLQRALEQLTASGLVFQRGTPPHSAYMFKHALVQDAAYETLLKSRRHDLHARIVQAYEDRFPEQAELQPELIAHHCSQADLTDKAIDYWDRAGQRGVRLSASAEAVAHFTKALNLLARFPQDAQQHDRRELGLQLALAGTALVAKGWGSPQMGEAYARARELCRKVGQVPEIVATLQGLFTFRLNRSEIAPAREAAEELLHLSERHDDSSSTAKLFGHGAMGISLVFHADFAGALAHLQRSLALYDPIKHRGPTIGGHDRRVACRGFTAWTLLFQGHPGRALVESQQALAHARELSHPYTLAFALHVNCLFEQVRRDWDALAERSAELVALAAEQGFPHVLATGTFFRGWALLAAGDAIDQAIAEMQRGLAAKQAIGAELKVPYYLGLLATAHTLANRVPEAGTGTLGRGPGTGRANRRAVV